MALSKHALRPYKWIKIFKMLGETYKNFRSINDNVKKLCPSQYRLLIRENWKLEVEICIIFISLD